MTSAQQDSRPERPDPFMDEVRALKQAAAEECGNDLETLGRRLRDMEKQYPDRMVQRPPDARSRPYEAA